ncbi:MAG TPA: saccharopine dehydrogenase C-terminal domain-containing protein [Acidimicrobiales bacterium]|nr:saccharopine dehydrogenase C-terminal domain-containing protein [Acidimicrobiales bacterium]
MKVLLVGAGGVGEAAAVMAGSRGFLEGLVVGDIAADRAAKVAARAAAAGKQTPAEGVRLDAGDAAAITELARSEGVDVIFNACDPRFVPSIFQAAIDAGTDYLDMAMSLSLPHPEVPYEQVGTILGEQQFAAHDLFVARGRLALVGCGVEPGLSDAFARYASDHLFESMEDVGVRDGANLVVEGYDFAPTFSIWTTIEECLNPPVIFERDRGWFTTPPFSEPEVFDFPEDIGEITCVNVEHEEVLLIPRWLEVGRATFKYGLGDEFIGVLQTLHKLGLDSTRPVTVRGQEVSPRDVVAACLPDPATLGDRMHGRTCAGTHIRGTGKDGSYRQVYLYHVSDNAETMGRHGCQAVVWQTAIAPVAALELRANGEWEGAGVLGCEAFDAVPLLDMFTDYGEPWHMRDEVNSGN